MREDEVLDKPYLQPCYDVCIRFENRSIKTKALQLSYASNGSEKCARYAVVDSIQRRMVSINLGRLAAHSLTPQRTDEAVQLMPGGGA